MSAAKFIRGANVTPVSTPPGPQPSDNAFRTILAKRAARIDELEIENADLQAQLEDTLSRVQPDIGDETHPDTTVATEDVAEDDYAILKRQYQNLEARHKKLQADYDAREKYVEVATKKYRKAKESAMQSTFLAIAHTRSSSSFSVIDGIGRDVFGRFIPFRSFSQPPTATLQ